MDQQRKHISIFLKRNELLYDIENISYIEGQMVGDENEHIQHTIIDAGQDGNVDRVTRIMNLAFAECVEALYPYTKIPVGNNELNDDFDAAEVYATFLSVPQGMSFTTVDLVKELMHEFVVCRVMYDWLSITKPAAADAWQLKAADAKHRILEHINARCGRIRRPMNPF